jgi:hypothetical protein
VRIVLLASLLVVVLPTVLRAEIVRWRDERGVTHYSDGIDSVPERYRATAESLGIVNRPKAPGSDRPVLRPEGEIFRFTPGRHIHVDRRRGVAEGVYVEAIRAPVQSLAVGNARVGRIAVNAYDMAMRDAEGLLGQDFLGHFNVVIDPERGIVTLTPRR